MALSSFSTFCAVCRRANAKWQLVLSSHPAVVHAALDGKATKQVIYFCPICDVITPQDLDHNDSRPMVIPPEDGHARIVFPDAQAYRQAMSQTQSGSAPGPFRSRSMKRHYDSQGREI